MTVFDDETRNESEEALPVPPDVSQLQGCYFISHSMRLAPASTVLGSVCTAC